MRRVRLLLLVPATALAVTACGSSSTAGSGTPAGSAPAGSASAGIPAATTSAAPADNGVAALSAEQILAKSKTALAAAASVHVTGSGSDSGTKIKLDMRYGQDGAVGTFTIDGQRLDLLRVEDDVYIKGSTAFWATNANAAAAKLLGDKYLKTTGTDERFKDLTSFTDLTAAADGFLEPDGTITKGETTKVAGQPAIGLVSKNASDGTLYVATTGRPYPLSVQGDGNSLTFTDYGKPVAVTAPPAAQVVDAATLPGS